MSTAIVDPLDFLRGEMKKSVHDYSFLAMKRAADEIVKLRLALEVAGDFACFGPPNDDPCECCLHVTEIVNGALGAPVSSGRSEP